ncbi:MAG: fumarylacetoacetate hydrolase family protein [Actinobacteria bacterium]|nr:fumarylacetoacetate hydrolase family protein [Actinomycetota bacterium]
MRLSNLLIHGVARPCVLLEDGYLDLVFAARECQCAIPSSIDGIIKSLESSTKIADEIALLASAAQKGSLPLIPLDDSLVFAPVLTAPGKILCIGLNYRDHVEECHDFDIAPAFPAVFTKLNNALAGCGEAIEMNPDAHEYDYEAELVMVIGKRTKRVSVEDAAESIFGYTVGNDVTSRELQRRTSQWFLGKGCDKFAPIGPIIVSADEIDAHDLAVTTKVNGDLRQNDTTKNMIFSPEEIVSYLSTFITLEAGDIIFCGTPSGVMMGYPQDKKQWLAPGDEVVVEIEGIGRLYNTFI